MKFNLGDLVKINQTELDDFHSVRDVPDTFNLRDIPQEAYFAAIGEIITIHDKHTSYTVWWPQLNGYNRFPPNCFKLANEK